MKHIHLLASLLIYVLSINAIWAQPYTIKRLGVEDGLSSNYVLDLVQDRKGYLWAATAYGLNRFDGRQFIVYDKSNSGLNGNDLNALLADPDEDKVWIGTNAGLYYFDYATEAIMPQVTSQTKSDITVNLSRSSDNGIWITYYSNGIEHYLPGKKQSTLYSPHNVPGLKGNFSTAIDDGKGNLYIGHSHEGLSVVSMTNRTCKNYRYNPDDPQSLPDNGVSVIYIDNNQNVWIGTYKGLALFNPQTESFTTFRHTEGNNYSLLANQVVDIQQMKDGTLWICTYLGGVSILNLQANTFITPENIHFENITANNGSHGLSGPNPRSVIQDSFGNIWMGNYRGGIDFISYAQPIFNTVTYTSDKSGKGNNKQVWGLCSDNTQHIWLGGEGKLGVYKKGEKMEIHSFDQHQLNPQTHINVIHQDKQQNFWLGTHRDGIFLYSSKDKCIRRIGDTNTENLDVCCFYEEPDGKIWIGTQSGIYSFQNNKLNYEKDICNQLPDKMVRGILRDKNGKLWIGTKGVVVLDANEKIFRSFTADKGFPANSVNHMIEDSHKRIWAGTSDGVVVFNDASQCDNYSFYATKEGLSNTNVRAIQEDQDGHIWISTNGGIARWEEKNKIFYNYNHYDGIPMGDFMDGSACISPDGTIYFGSQSGACYFNPREVASIRTTSPVAITQFSIYNKKTESKDTELSVPTANGYIQLLHHQNTFKISFNVLDYTQNPQVEFAYMLEGLENAWYNTQGDNQVTFRNIPPGNYTFKVKTRLRNQEWDDSVATLNVYIAPPLWLTWYAKLFYVLIFVLALYGILRFYKRKIDLESSLEVERKKSQNEQELNNERLRFYTNITHELRTPLTLILGPLEDLLSDNTLAPKHANKISIIHDSSTRLLNLINGILEFRKTETQNRKLSVNKGNIARLIQEVGLRYKELNANPKITFQVQIETKETELFFDADMITIILDNLMSNASKYTSEGNIILTLRSIEENQIKYTEISVSDTGHGIEADALPHIFDRYYQAKSKFQASGSGIGLALVKGLSELHEGTLKVVSTPEIGTTFSLRLLTDNTYPNAIHGHSATPKKEETEEGATEIQAEGHPILLVVEDNADIREYIQSSFCDIYEVVTAKDGKEGWELAQSRIPNIIISDIMMPVMDGIELCKLVKEDMRTSHIPVILLTAKDSLQDKEEGYASGADSYLTKPFSAKLLHSRINNLLETRKKIATLLASNTSPKQENASHSLNKLDNEFIEKITHIIEEHLDMEKMDIAFIADKMCMSHSTLYRKIKGLTDMSANEFIRKVKMRNSVKLLLAGEYTISEIAFMTGFSSVAYFRQCFKDEYGVAPSDYIKQHQ